jgi:hypothetical protein
MSPPGQELVYVPLQMFPFTLDRVIRWRDILGPRLRKPQLRWVMQYLEDRKSFFFSEPALQYAQNASPDMQPKVSTVH